MKSNKIIKTIGMSIVGIFGVGAIIIPTMVLSSCSTTDNPQEKSEITISDSVLMAQSSTVKQTVTIKATSSLEGNSITLTANIDVAVTDITFVDNLDGTGTLWVDLGTTIVEEQIITITASSKGAENVTTTVTVKPEAYNQNFEYTKIGEQGYSVKASVSFTITGNLAILDIYNNLPVIIIGDNGFTGKTGITGLALPNELKTIDNQAFYNCANLASVDIPASVTEIKHNAFFDCFLKSINIDPNNQNYKKATNVGSDATVIVSGGTSELGNDCSNIAPGLVTGSVVLVEDDATTIRISGAPGTAETSFMDCWGLTSIVIPASVNQINSTPLQGCKNLTSITMLDEETPPSLGFDAFLGSSPDLKIYVPGSALNLYKSAANWSDYAGIIVAIE